MTEGCTVLVVDDEPSIREVVTEVLELEGYRVLSAGNGAEALEQIMLTRPTLVLLDMRMPVMDGWAFAREVQDRAISMKICVMTAAQNAKAWADEIHAHGYLAKPFEIPQLLEAVERGCFGADGRSTP